MEVNKRPLVFTEWHHGGLFHAMALMFENRLGGTLAGPVGYEWQTEGIWKLSENPDTIKQYLNPDVCTKGQDGFQYWLDKAENYPQKRITFEQFKKTKFDIILCTLQQHEYTFRELWQKYQPQAKYIRLCGNVGEQVNWDNFNNFIDTTKLYRPPSNINSVTIHQEFPAEYFFYTEPRNHQRISNFMNQLHEAEAYQIWKGLKDRMSDYEFKMHGSGGDDGMIDGLPNLAQSMRDSAFIFQVKHHGEGFGHVIHNAYAVGRPVIAMLEFYKGKWAEQFLINDYSAIILENYILDKNKLKNIVRSDLDKLYSVVDSNNGIGIEDLDFDRLIFKIKYWSKPENHRRMCQNARKLFEKYVDFDKDEYQFREFLKKLK